MTNKLRAAAEMALEALDWVVKDNDSYDPFDDRWDDVHKAVLALRQALAESDKHIKELRANLNRMRHFQEWGEVGFATGERIAGYNAAVDEMLEHLREMGLDDDTGIDRGAWSDVPDATKWVDELRGDEPVAKVCHNLPQHIGWNPKITHLPDEGTPLYAAPLKTQFECPRCGHCCQQVEEPPNSTTDVVKSEWQGLTDDEIAETVGSPLDEVYLTDFRRVEAKLKERNT